MLDSSVPLLMVGLPAFGAIAVALLRGRGDVLPRALTLVLMLGLAALALRVFLAYDTTPAVRFDDIIEWMPSLGIHLHLGVDGFNVYLMLLSALLFPVVLACAWSTAEARRPLYLALLLLLESGLLGTFLSQNLLLFFAFWEAVLIPMGILILVFGGRQRQQAATAFFLYTLAGSVLLLAAVIALGVECLLQTGQWSFELSVLYELQLSWRTQLFVFVAIMLACAVKCPLIPFHSWLPLAYSEAPPSGAALMAGVLSKMGALGILKLALPLAPDVAIAAAPYMVSLAVASILYGAVLALRQQEYRKVVAYASLSHMAYIVLGIFSFQQTSIHGSMLQMLSHGAAVAGLFLLLGLLEQRGGAAAQASAIARTAPRFAVLLMLFILTSLALPLTSGFTAEFLILYGTFAQGLAAWRSGSGTLLLSAAVLASLGMVLGAAYMLRFARSILFRQGARASPPSDLRVPEIVPLLAPLLLILWLGITPAPVMGKVQDVVSRLSSTPAIADARKAHGN